MIGFLLLDAPDVILMDIHFQEGVDGITAAERIRAYADTPVIFITGFGEEELIQRAKHVQPFAYVMKPYNPREIRASIEIALYKKNIERKLRDAHDDLERKVAERTAEVARMVEKLNALMNASSDSAVLIDLEGTVMTANAVAAARVRHAT